MLLERFLQEQSLEASWMLSRILRPHGLKLKKEQIKRIGQRLEELIDADSALREPSLQLLRYIAPEYTLEHLLARVTKLKDEARYQEALRAIELFSDGEQRSTEVHLLMGILHLKLSAKLPDPAARAADRALEIFSFLIVEEQVPLLERLIGEPSLGADDVYYLAINFADRLNDEGEFGHELLKHFAKQYPKDKNAKNALARLSLAQKAG
jgi:hypothetical protein